MPKTYLTSEDRRRAEATRRQRVEDDILAGTLKRARKAAGYTQRDLAKKVGYDPGTVGNIEREPGTARISQLREICFALNVDIDFSAVLIQKGAIT